MVCKTTPVKSVNLPFYPAAHACDLSRSPYRGSRLHTLHVNKTLSTPAHAVDHYENFPVASWLCPPQLRPAIAAIYWFARTADDIADEGDRKSVV